MSLPAVLMTALSSLGANKLRTALALLGIVIGVAAVISTMSAGRGAQSEIISRIGALGANLLFVYPQQTPNGVSGNPHPGGRIRAARPCQRAHREAGRP